MGIVTSMFDRFIYRPDVLYAPAGFTPASLRIDFEDVNLSTSDGLCLHGWYLRAPGPRFSLLFCHGNAGDCRDWVNCAIHVAWWFHSRGCQLKVTGVCSRTPAKVCPARALLLTIWSRGTREQ